MPTTKTVKTLPNIKKKESNMPLRIFKINKTKEPDDKKNVDLSDKLEKLETEKGNTEEGEKKRKKVKFF